MGNKMKLLQVKCSVCNFFPVWILPSSRPWKKQINSRSRKSLCICWTLSWSYFSEFKWSSTDLLHLTPNCCKGFEMPPGSWHWLHPSAPGWSSVVPACLPGDRGRKKFSALTFIGPWRGFSDLARQGKFVYTHPSPGEKQTAKCIPELCI